MFNLSFNFFLNVDMKLISKALDYCLTLPVPIPDKEKKLS